MHCMAICIPMQPFALASTCRDVQNFTYFFTKSILPKTSSIPSKYLKSISQSISNIYTLQGSQEKKFNLHPFSRLFRMSGIIRKFTNFSNKSIPPKPSQLLPNTSNPSHNKPTTFIPPRKPGKYN